MDVAVSESELVRRAQQGDLQAFESLATGLERRIYSLAFRMLRNQEDAEDVTQQTFLSALENLQNFRSDSSFSTWLLRIASNAALKVIRKRSGLQTMPYPEEEQGLDNFDSVPHPEYIADWRQSPEELVQRHEMQALLDEALISLDEKHRIVFLLRDVEGMSIKETADTLGVSEANTKVRLLRARLQLREALTRKLGDPNTRLQRLPRFGESKGSHHNT
jgi:RNA polymerase sigma-70 factor (ECF subfamily)